MRRAPLSRDRVLQAAVALVDHEGLDALTMRKLGATLGVEAMSLYKHVRNKDAILDGIVDLVGAEIEVSPGDRETWQGLLRRRATASRVVFTRHPWAIGLLESRRVLGPNLLRSLDAALGGLQGAGFTIDAAAHALWLLDSFVYGHVIQETSRRKAGEGATQEMLEQVRSSGYPHLADLGQHALTEGFTADAEFDIGLELILQALAGLQGAPPERLSGPPS